MEKEQYNHIVSVLNQSADVLDAAELFSFFEESYEELRDWCMHAPKNA